MKLIIGGLIVALFLAPDGLAQKRKKPTRTTRASRSAAAPKKEVPPMIGSQVVILTKNGDLIKGELLDLTAYSARIRAGKLESTIALDTITALSFDESAISASQTNQADAAMHADFGRDAERVLGEFKSAAANFTSGIDYTGYGHQLTDLRRTTERFIGKYGASENKTEARVVALLAGSLTDYTWARTIWTLKLGRASDGTVSESDSPAVADSLSLYPDLREMAASASRISGDKLIAGLWKKAAEKVERARAALSEPQ